MIFIICIKFCFPTIATGNHVKEGKVLPKVVFENNSTDFISNIKDAFDVT
jgi:hypothetical protein